MNARRIPLIQYWHTSTPPPDVQEAMATWQEDPGFNRILFDEASADDFIAEHFDARTLRAFRSCAVPAMQSDMLRYAALFVHGGAYADAGMANRGRAAELFETSRRGYLFLRGADEDPAAPGMRPGRVINGLMFVRDPRDPLMMLALEQATTNVLGRISNNVWQVTGPGIMTAIYAAGGPDADRVFDGFTIEPLTVAEKAVEFRWLAYKTSETDWRGHLEDQSGSSLYRDVAADEKPAPGPTIKKRLGERFSMNLFRRAVDLDRDLIDDPTLTRWLWADVLHSRGERGEMSFYHYVGPRHVRRYMTWIDKFPYPDWFGDRVAPLADISEKRDRDALAALGFRDDGVDLHAIGRYNAQDYLLQRFYPMPDQMAPRVVLDFGAGHGRQANLAFHNGDTTTETMISVDGIPGSYLTQRAYYAALGLSCADYVEARVRGRNFDFAERAANNQVVHLPTWRLDLVPDDSVDLAIAIQVLNELPRPLVVRVMREISRVLKPGGAFYIRDRVQGHRPNDMPMDKLLLAHGLTLEFSPAVRDMAQIHGVPRIWRKLDPSLYY